MILNLDGYCSRRTLLSFDEALSKQAHDVSSSIGRENPGSHVEISISTPPH